MTQMNAHFASAAAAIRRFDAIMPLDEGAIAALHEAARRPRRVSAHHELLTEGTAISEPHILLSGWGARVRILPDGRRQILSLLLPGDMIGHCYQPQPLAITSVVALTAIDLCPAPSTDEVESLRHVYAISHALDEAFLLAQITRLGRMSAYERLADLFLELLERLSLSGNAQHNAFDHPLTQELVADVTGLTPVHVNRVVKRLRHRDEPDWHTGYLTLSDPDALRRRIGRTPFQISQAMRRRG